ncbi:MAG: hypothetical protein CM15mP58_09210 [Burkholderiaceae bacterium]|nr:MAG: hypothetical protein CM15mP58_09210 [Burkholderiaceae bacterium]
MALGSIPQQDVFQRANAAQNASIASVALPLEAFLLDFRFGAPSFGIYFIYH